LRNLNEPDIIKALKMPKKDGLYRYDKETIHGGIQDENSIGATARRAKSKRDSF
jgi:hypothetical protein